jgi:hypothetical protein
VSYDLNLWAVLEQELYEFEVSSICSAKVDVRANTGSRLNKPIVQASAERSVLEVYSCQDNGGRRLRIKAKHQPLVLISTVVVCAITDE